MAGILNIAGLSSSEPAGQRTLGPLSIQGSIVIGETIAQALIQGDNTVTVPTGAVGVVVIPPTTGAVVIKYRTSINSGDVGLQLSPSAPSVHVFPSPAPTAVIINASAAQSSPLSLWFW